MTDTPVRLPRLTSFHITSRTTKTCDIVHTHRSTLLTPLNPSFTPVNPRDSPICPTFASPCIQRQPAPLDFFICPDAVLLDIFSLTATLGISPSPCVVSFSFRCGGMLFKYSLCRLALGNRRNNWNVSCDCVPTRAVLQPCFILSSCSLFAADVLVPSSRSWEACPVGKNFVH